MTLLWNPESETDPKLALDSEVLNRILRWNNRHGYDRGWRQCQPQFYPVEQFRLVKQPDAESREEV